MLSFIGKQILELKQIFGHKIMAEYEFEIDGQNIIGYIEDNKLTIPNHYDNEPLTKCEVDKHGCVWCFLNGDALIGLPLE